MLFRLSLFPNHYNLRRPIPTESPNSFSTMSTYEAKASLTGVPHGIEMYEQEKLGGKFCFCCCDMRRATMIISIFHLGLSAIVLTLLIAGESLWLAYGKQIKNDELLEEIEKASFTQMAFTSAGLISSCCSLIGAIKYNIWLVGINIFWLIVCWISGMVIEINTINEIGEDYSGTEDLAFNWFGNFISALVLLFFWIYPMGMFISEVRQGIMTPETYPREEFSCCCSRRYYKYY